MIHERNLVFTLHTLQTTYLFRVNESNHLEHLYYGRRLRSTTHFEAFIDKHTIPIGASVAYNEELPTLFLENLCLEYSTYGKGDFRESQILFSKQNGDRVSDFQYKEHRIIKGKPRTFSGLPESIGESNECATLVIVLVDKASRMRLEMGYSVFEASDVVTRKISLVNDSTEPVGIERFFSLQLDLPSAKYDLVTFDGSWARERYRNERPLCPGIVINDSKTGMSSARHNPCIFLKEQGKGESEGDCYGSNLIYSGDHCEAIEVSPYGKTRLLSGLNPASFRWRLNPGEKFQSPEAILTFSHEGLNGASNHFHRFINNNIIRGDWKFHQRPILINNWEATYFKFSENKLIALAKSAADLGIELFVLDDGWFGSREDDTTSLGDWKVNTKKLPNGLASLSKKIHHLGMLFGLWCEPEMVSKQSALFREHPEWMVGIPDRQASPGRNQYLLDLTREDVRDYLFKALSTVWNMAEVDYVKWDMNRPFSDMYSNTPSFRQDEFNHRYILGLYELLDRFTKAFPHILFESCASGGNRFDLGMLCYMPQTWTSDNTDALCRMHIQEGTSCGYPLSTMGAHVSTSPNHQTLRETSIESRFNVASFGILGYELDLTSIAEHEKESVRNQVYYYKLYRSLFQFGDFFRVEPIANETNQSIWAVASADRSEMIILFFQTLNTPNAGADVLRIPIADPEATYAITPRKERISLRLFGDLINRVSVIKLKNDSPLERIVTDKISLESEMEYYIVPGDVLAYGGIKLNQQFSGTGYDKETRVIGDFGSRLYHCKKMQ